MEFKEIKDLMNEFNSSNTREMEISSGDFHIHLSKNETSFQAAAPAPATVADQPASAPQKPADVKEPSENEAEEGNLIKAPMVGSIYLQPAPEKDPYISVGQKIKKGDIVCVVEAMKMMTEIKSDFSGKVSEILVDNEELVEFDQPLFRIEED